MARAATGWGGLERTAAAKGQGLDILSRSRKGKFPWNHVARSALHLPGDMDDFGHLGRAGSLLANTGVMG